MGGAGEATYGRMGPYVVACEAVYARVDAAVKAAGVGDAEYRRIDGFPYFRIDRFLASYDLAGFDDAQRTAWIDRLVARDLEARAVEIGNLPPAAAQSLRAQLNADPTRRIKACAAVLRAHDHASPKAHRDLRHKAVVKDDYSALKRAFGLYPASAPFVNWGFRAWKRQNLAVFDLDRAALPVRGRLQAYWPPGGPPPDSAAIRALVDQSRTNPLDIPEPEGQAASRIISAFAPVWVVDRVTGDDDIGQPHWPGSGVPAGASDGPSGRAPGVNTGDPVTFTRFSHIHWGGRVLLQVNYLIWFPARPPEDGSDPLAGAIDGLIWRVTLGPNGTPLIYDSIHPCGCYHLFFPTDYVSAKKSQKTSGYSEGVTTIKQVVKTGPGGRLAIRIAPRTHYIQHVTPVKAGDLQTATSTQYRLADYHTLRALSWGEGASKSLFRPDGLIAGTQRGERRWLWVSGIKSPGAMRQWGRHATAFVGKRHFDDPWLFKSSFDRREDPGQ